jgi:type II secretory pathway component GspD/PulD (secretin)
LIRLSRTGFGRPVADAHIETSRRIFLGFLFIGFLSVTVLHLAQAQTAGTPREPIVVQVIQLDHADANQLAATLSPLLSKHGSIVPYVPTNTLIIRDRKSIVENLVRIIKGPADSQADQRNSEIP